MGFNRWADRGIDAENPRTKTRALPLGLVTPPQVGILAVGRSIQRPLVGADGSLTSGPVATATLSADHRVVDGADAARFLASFKSALENPESLSPTTAQEAA